MTKKNPNLTAEQKLVLFEDGTEPPGTSELNNEKRKGSYHCANCGIKLFNSSTKYESGSGWPSFYESLPDVFETKTDHLLGYARTEYHCKNCGGHHGHIFDDHSFSLKTKHTPLLQYLLPVGCGPSSKICP